MSRRMNKEREQRLQPSRIVKAIKEISELGYDVIFDSTRVEFIFKGETVVFYPYSGWASGKSIKDGRGLKNLLLQLAQ